MTEDEIRGLDGRELDLHAHHCIVDGDPVWLLPQNRSRVPHYSSDIAAAFDVDRPEWRWDIMADEFEGTRLEGVLVSVNDDGSDWIAEHYEKPHAYHSAHTCCTAAATRYS